MAMLARDLAVMIRAAPRLLRAIRDDVAFSRPPAGRGVFVGVAHPSVVRSVALAWAFFGGVAAMCAAVWVDDDTPRRGGAGHIILYAAFVPMVVAVGLGDGFDDLVLAVNVIDALL
ncbi:hypothetical protein ACP70R_031178 [Stipagrostis hirtigluma subsp. patula]